MPVPGAVCREHFHARVMFAAKRLVLVMLVNVPNQTIFIALFENISAACGMEGKRGGNEEVVVWCRLGVRGSRRQNTKGLMVQLVPTWV